MIRNTLFNSGKFFLTTHTITYLCTDLSFLGLSKQTHKLQNIRQLSNPKILLNHRLVMLKTYVGSFHDDHSVIL